MNIALSRRALNLLTRVSTTTTLQNLTYRSSSSKVSVNFPKDVEQVSDLMKNHMENIVDVKLEIAKKYHRFLKFGHKGETIKKIEHKFPEVFVTFPKEGDSDKFSISGPHEDVEQVSDLIMKQLENIVDVELDIEKKYHGFLCGHKGERIEKIRLKFPEVSLNFPDEPDRNKVSIFGHHEDVKQVSDLIMKQLENIGDVELDIENKYRGFLLGHKGEKIEKMRLKFPEVSVNFSKDSDKVTISGPHEAVEQVSDLIMKQLENIVEVELDIEKNDRVLLLGHKGERIQKMRLKFPEVFVSFPREEDKYNDKVLISGPHEDVEHVADLMKKQIEEFVHVELDIENEYYGFLLGHEGKNIKKIRLKFPEVFVFLFKQSDNNIDKALISGPGDDTVQQVRDFLEKEQKEQLSSLCEEAVTIDPNLYGRLIGPNGRNIKTLLKESECGYVNLDFNRSSSNIIIKGLKADVVIVKEKLMSLAQEESYCAEIHVEKNFIKVLIGKKGANIKRVRKEYDVSCMIPSRNNDSTEDTTAVKITGRREQVDKAVEDVKRSIERVSAKHFVAGVP